MVSSNMAYVRVRTRTHPPTTPRAVLHMLPQGTCGDVHSAYAKLNCSLRTQRSTEPVALPSRLASKPGPRVAFHLTTTGWALSTLVTSHPTTPHAPEPSHEATLALTTSTTSAAIATTSTTAAAARPATATALSGRTIAVCGLVVDVEHVHAVEVTAVGVRGALGVEASMRRHAMPVITTGAASQRVWGVPAHSHIQPHTAAQPHRHRQTHTQPHTHQQTHTQSVGATRSVGCTSAHCTNMTGAGGVAVPAFFWEKDAWDRWRGWRYDICAKSPSVSSPSPPLPPPEPWWRCRDRPLWPSPCSMPPALRVTCSRRPLPPVEGYAESAPALTQAPGEPYTPRSSRVVSWWRDDTDSGEADSVRRSCQGCVGDEGPRCGRWEWCMPRRLRAWCSWA